MKNFLYILFIILLLFLLLYIYYSQTNKRILERIYCDKNQKLLVLRNFNSQAGLHWMGVFCVIKMLHTAKKYNLKPVVIMDTGLYLETKAEHQQKYKDIIDKNNNEWFSYYFEPIGINDPLINRMWKSGQLNNLPNFTEYKPEKCVIGYEFKRDSLNQCKNEDVDFNKEYSENIKLKPYLQKAVDEFYDKNMKGKFLIGIHVRGTDKYASQDSSEDNPKHFMYEQYCNLVEKEVINQNNLHPGTKVAVFACSDEQPFIDYITKNLGNRYDVITTGDMVLRSNVSTSGLNLKTESCGGNGIEQPDCDISKRLVEQSIHRGM